jgi:hypothetical protein
LFAVAADDDRKRHFQRALEKVGDGRDPAVKDDIAGFRQCLVFQIDDVF